MKSLRQALSLLTIVSSIYGTRGFLASPRIGNVNVAKPFHSRPLIPLTSTSSPGDEATSPTPDSPSTIDLLAASLSKTAAVELSRRYNDGGPVATGKSFFNFITLIRVGIPAVVGGIVATAAFPGMALFLASIMNDAGVFTVLSQDSSQFVQNFLTVSGLLFSILVGQT